MSSWQIWQLLVKLACISVVMLIEQVVGVPLLSLLLLYWWFGRNRRHLSVIPLAIFSGVLGLLYGGSLSIFYLVLSVWWWLTTQVTGANWLRSILVFGSACGATALLFLTFDQVRWEFAFGWVVISAVVWWRLHQGSQGSKHVI